MTSPAPHSSCPHPLRGLTLDELRRRTSIKWRSHSADVLPLWVAEMDVLVAEPVVRAITDAMRSGDTGYPAGTGYSEAYADFASQRWAWDGLDPARTAIVTDVMTGIVEAIRLVSEPGDPVIINPPVYPPFAGYVEHASRVVVEAPLGPDGRLDLVSLEKAFVSAGSGGRPVTYLLCNPHNPTAVVHTADELAAVAALAEAYAVRVVVDEIHGPLAAADFVPYLSVAGTGTAFSVASASKAWNLAGMKAALLVGGEETADVLARLPEVVSHGPSHFGVVAHVAALSEGRTWLDGLQIDLAENRTILSGLLEAYLPGVRWNGGGGTYLAWLDCRDLGLGDDPAEQFLDVGRVAVNSGLPFGSGGAGHVRLNYATTPEILAEAVERMARTLRA